jgi:hypothetical protein
LCHFEDDTVALQYQKVLLIRHFTQAPKQLSQLTLLKVKRSLLVLKDAVDLFNDIFGWNILLSIFFGAVRSLIYIETTVRREENVGGHDVSENYWQVAARVSYAFFYWVSSAHFVILLSLLS